MAKSGNKNSEQELPTIQVKIIKIGDSEAFKFLIGHLMVLEAQEKIFDKLLTNDLSVNFYIYSIRSQLKSFLK